MNKKELLFKKIKEHSLENIKTIEDKNKVIEALKKERDIWRKHSNYFEQKIYKMMRKVRMAIGDKP